MSFEEAVAGTRERLIRSVELRLRADVPLAFLMSGGVDSLSLISIARRVFDHDVHGFTIVNSDERYEEQDMVEHAVERLGVRHTSIALDTRDFLPRLRELVRHHDAPVYTITYFVQWLLMQAIHRARLPRLGQRHGRRRALQRLLRPPPRLPARGARRAGTARGLAARVAGARAADHPQPVPVQPRPVRRRPGLPRPHLPRAPRSSPPT